MVTWVTTVKSVANGLGLEDDQVFKTPNKPRIAACGEMTMIQFYQPNEYVMYLRTAIINTITIHREKPTNAKSDN